MGEIEADSGVDVLSTSVTSGMGLIIVFLLNFVASPRFLVVEVSVESRRGANRFRTVLTPYPMHLKIEFLFIPLIRGVVSSSRNFKLNL